MAPVKAPRSKPKSSDSSSSDGSAAQLTFTKVLSRRGDEEWTARATSSLPVPLSPRIRTVTSVSATRLMRSRTSRIFSLVPSSSPMTRGGRGGRGSNDDSLACVSSVSSSRPFMGWVPPKEYRVARSDSRQAVEQGQCHE